jgi:hypothetical protein
MLKIDLDNRTHAKRLFQIAIGISIFCATILFLRLFIDGIQEQYDPINWLFLGIGSVAQAFGWYLVGRLVK